MFLRLNRDTQCSHNPHPPDFATPHIYHAPSDKRGPSRLLRIVRVARAGPPRGCFGILDAPMSMPTNQDSARFIIYYHCYYVGWGRSQDLTDTFARVNWLLGPGSAVPSDDDHELDDSSPDAGASE